MRRLFDSKLLLCGVFLALNIFIQLTLVSFAGIWAPAVDIVVPQKIDCQCTEPDQSKEPAMCTVPSENSKEDHTHYLLFVLILSSTSGLVRRNVARETWIQGYQKLEQPVIVKFVIGTQNLQKEEVQGLKSEQDNFGDLLILPNLQEDYSNLTRKVLYSFTRIARDYKFSYLLKCDDDSYILLNKVVTELSSRDSAKSFYWGFFDGRAHVKTKGKWAEKKWFLCDRYLPYALGGGYILSQDLVQRIATSADGLEMYNSEDVSVGVWLSPYKAERKHDVRFNTEFVSRGCRNSYIVSHKQSPEDMKSKFKNLQAKGEQCDKEYQTRLSYEYNWSNFPTECCERQKGIP